MRHTVEQFIAEHQGDASMTRYASVVTVETSDGWILARAKGIADTAYAASRSSAKAVGPAVAAAIFGDFDPHNEGAFESPSAALAYARGYENFNR